MAVSETQEKCNAVRTGCGSDRTLTEREHSAALPAAALPSYVRRWLCLAVTFQPNNRATPSLLPERGRSPEISLESTAGQSHRLTSDGEAGYSPILRFCSSQEYRELKMKNRRPDHVFRLSGSHATFYNRRYLDHERSANHENSCNYNYSDKPVALYKCGWRKWTTTGLGEEFRGTGDPRGALRD